MTTTYMKTTSNMSDLGDRIRSITLASMSQNIKNALLSNDKQEDIKLPASENARGRLEINVVEGRNLTISDASNVDIYCIVHYEGNVTSTLDKTEDDLLTSVTSSTLKSKANNSAFKAFEIMMSASSPKWMHRVSFDVNKGDSEVTLFVYDRGNKLANGEDRFLGMSAISPCLINKKTVELIFPLHGRPGDEQEVTGDVRLQLTYGHAKITKIKREDFRIVRMIGEGPVGKVYQVVKKDSDRTYAMKVLSKRALLAGNEVDVAFTERNILVNQLFSPFIAGLKYSFQTANHLFLVMDYFSGGDLFNFLERERCVSEDHCQMFAAEIICAFDNIHARNVVYRNLKLESILMDAHGHIALTDFGICKQLKNEFDVIMDVPENITQEYLAPEMVMQQPYGKASDWWSLGVLIFELLTGLPPFHSINESELLRQILEYPVKFPSGNCISKEAQDFVTRLLDRNPATRLGSKGGVAEVKSHDFFKDINWNVVYNKQMQLPFVPEDDGQQLTEEYNVTSVPANFPISEKKLANTHIPLLFDQSRFKGFSFIREDNIVNKGVHCLNINPEDEDPEIDFWFRR